MPALVRSRQENQDIGVILSKFKAALGTGGAGSKLGACTHTPLFCLFYSQALIQKIMSHLKLSREFYFYLKRRKFSRIKSYPNVHFFVILF